jgi:hypothetical protein
MSEQHDIHRLLDQAESAKAAGDLASAEGLLRSAARIQEEELGPLHPDLANTLNNLAVVAEMTGRSSEAETLYRRGAAIASAVLPSDHPMVVASRQNLEDFCRARGLSIDTPVIVTPARDVEPEANAVAPAAPAPPGKASRSVGWVAAGVVVLLAVLLLALRPWSSRDAPAPAPAPAVTQPAKSEPPEVAPPPARSAPIEHAGSASAAPRPDGRTSATDKPSGVRVTVVTAQVCRTFSATGSSWRCDPVGSSAAPGPMVLYTRVSAPVDTTVLHRWYQGDTLRQSVILRIQANATEGYRTYSRLTVDEGEWRLEVRSMDGQLLHEQRFAVR